MQGIDRRLIQNFEWPLFTMAVLVAGIGIVNLISASPEQTATGLPDTAMRQLVWLGIGIALMFATLGVQVTVIDGRKQLLEFCDQEIMDTLLHHARAQGIVFRLGESVVSIREPKPGLVAVELESGKRLLGETVLFSVGRVGDTSELRLERAGLAADDALGRVRDEARAHDVLILNKPVKPAALRALITQVRIKRVAAAE